MYIVDVSLICAAIVASPSPQSEPASAQYCPVNPDEGHAFETSILNDKHSRSYFCDECFHEQPRGSLVYSCNREGCSSGICAGCFADVNHRLSPYIWNTTDEVYVCDICGREQEIGSQVYDCTACDWGQCEECYHMHSICRKPAAQQKKKRIMPWLIGLKIKNQNGRIGSIRDYRVDGSSKTRIWWQDDPTESIWVNLHHDPRWEYVKLDLKMPPTNSASPIFTFHQVVEVKCNLGTNRRSYEAFINGYDGISNMYHVQYTDSSEWLWSHNRVTPLCGEASNALKEAMEADLEERIEIQDLTPPPFDSEAYARHQSKSQKSSRKNNRKRKRPETSQKSLSDVPAATGRAKRAKQDILCPSPSPYPYPVRQKDHVATVDVLRALIMYQLRTNQQHIGYHGEDLWDPCPLRSPRDLCDYKLWSGKTLFVNPPWSKYGSQVFLRERMQHDGLSVFLVPYGGNKLYWEHYVWKKAILIVSLRSYAFAGYNSQPAFPTCLLFFNPNVTPFDLQHHPTTHINVKKWAQQMRNEGKFDDLLDDFNSRLRADWPLFTVEGDNEDKSQLLSDCVI